MSKVSLADALEKRLQRPVCKVTATLDSLQGEDRDVFSMALEDAFNVSSIRLSDALADIGVVLSPSTILRHRNGSCPCPGN